MKSRDDNGWWRANKEEEEEVEEMKEAEVIQTAWQYQQH